MIADMTEKMEVNLEAECGEKILKNLDKQLRLSGQPREKINRLLSMRHFVSTHVLHQSN